MKRFKQRIKMLKVSQIFNVIALLLVIQSVNSTCFWVHYQPNVPESASKFKVKIDGKDN